MKIKTIDAKPKKAFYGDRISDNMTHTPEGFLVCHNVPIARTGTQDYLGEEIGITEKANELVSVIREDKEVFNPAALASFEGKAVTNEHPGDDVIPKNYKKYLKGHVTNVRRGVEADNDKIIADLVIYDPSLINEIENGKREISCGYDCIYELDDEGNVYQCGIKGNHVAVVDRGRAGHKVRIKDGKPNSERRISFMANKKKNIIAKILSFAKDADPDEVAEVIEEVQDMQSIQDNVPETKDNGSIASKDNESIASKDNEPSTQKDNSNEVLTQILSELKGLGVKIAALETKDTCSGELEKLEDELSSEASVTQPVEEMEEGTKDTELTEDEEITEDEESVEDEETTEDEELTEDEETTDEVVTVKNNDSLIKLIQTMKPVIANIKNDKERKRATDALTKTVRDLQCKQRKQVNNGYAKILDAKNKHAQKLANKKVHDSITDERSIGENIAKSRNPHYKSKN